jgi:hypothetical protein
MAMIAAVGVESPPTMQPATVQKTRKLSEAIRRFEMAARTGMIRWR